MGLFQKLSADQQKIRQALNKIINEIDTLHGFVVHLRPSPNPVPTFAISDCGCADIKKMASDLAAIRERLAAYLKR